MDIQDLTLREVAEINRITLSGCGPTIDEKGSILSGAIGKYVLIRSRSEGINAGILVKADETGCVLDEARRLWKHIPLDDKKSWYEGVAESGLRSGSKISCAVSTKYIMEDYSICICTKNAEKSIREYQGNES